MNIAAKKISKTPPGEKTGGVDIKELMVGFESSTYCPNYTPLKFGSLFSRKAFAPSAASSVCCSLARTLSAYS